MSGGGEPGERIRNLGIVAHINAGKTTLSERILFDTGKQRFMGDVEAGTATMDWMREEQERGISIQAAVTCVEWRGFVLNLIDTPGHVDFTVEVERCLQALDGLIVVVDGVRGVESQTEAVWRQAERHRLPRLLFVNKLDRAAADFGAALGSVRERLGARAVPVVAPIREEGRLAGLADLVGGRAVRWDGAPAAVDPAARLALHEACADLDPDLMAAFVEDREPARAALHEALRRGTGAGSIVPVLCGSALENRGVDWLLDAVCRYLPPPSEHPALPAGGAFAGLVFKVHNDVDEHVGYLRVFAGGLGRGDEVETAAGERFAVDRLWTVHAARRDEVDRAGPGRIVALPLPPGVRSGETLRAPGSAVELEPQRFPAPVLTIALEPRASAQRAELERVAREIAFEDPTLRVRVEPGGDLQVAGMGELHLEVFGSRLERTLPGVARFGRPAVELRDTVAGTGTGRAECERAVGDRRLRAAAVVAVAPAAGDVAVGVAEGLAADPCAGELRAALLARAEAGLVEAHPLTGARLTILTADAPRAAADLAEARVALLAEAVEVAAARAVQAAVRRVLEPWMRLRVECAPDALGFVLADLEARLADIDRVEPGIERALIEGRVRLSAVLGYATVLRSKTKGRGDVELRFDGFA